MANIVVTSDTNCIKVDFGDYGSNPNINTDKATYPRRTLSEVNKPHGMDYLIISMSNGVSVREWLVSFQSVPSNPSVLVIDSIDATAPTTLDQLFDLIGGLIVA